MGIKMLPTSPLGQHSKKGISYPLSYSYTGNLYIPGEAPEVYHDEESKTLQEIQNEAEDPEEVWMPSFVPFLQLNFGLKAKTIDQVHILVDFGILDGFLIRGDLAFHL
jgi:hypothetical protein